MGILLSKKIKCICDRTGWQNSQNTRKNREFCPPTMKIFLMETYGMDGASTTDDAKIASVIPTKATNSVLAFCHGAWIHGFPNDRRCGVVEPLPPNG
jgi:hypothetical protein